MRYDEITGQTISGQPLSEAPQIIGSTDFGMSNEDHRYKFTRYLLNLQPQKLLGEGAKSQLFRAGSGAVVYFYLLEQPHGRLVYFVKCEAANVAFIGPTVTQVALWRDEDSAAVQGITQQVFFDHLLKDWPIVMSDEQQTPSGMEFWRRRLAMAADKGFRVGLADLANKTVTWRADEPYQEWIKANEGAWSTDPAAQNLRFLIARP